MEARGIWRAFRERDMHFRIGPTCYRIKISELPLTDSDDLPVASQYSWKHGVIELSCAIPSQRRLDAMMYELARAWEFHLGVPNSADGRANRMSSFTIDVWRQIELQGGASELYRLSGDGMATSATVCEDLPSIEAYATSCPRCNGTIGVGEIINSSARFCAKHARLVIDRCVRCDHCKITVAWTEAATTLGGPTGKVLAGPFVRDGTSISRH